MSFLTAIPVAIKVASTLADGYKFVKEHPEEVQQAMDDATKAASAAKKFVGDTSDRLGVDDHLARARKATDRAKRLASSTTSAFRFRKGNEAERQLLLAEQEAAEAIREARQIVLESADLRTSLPRLVERLDGSDEELAKCMSVLDAPGVFAIATYGKFDVNLDFTDFKGIYVGSAAAVGDGIATAISRAGNPDVYADVKYNQNVLIFVFNCAEDELRYRSRVLVDVLGADRSYNMPVA